MDPQEIDETSTGAPSPPADDQGRSAPASADGDGWEAIRTLVDEVRFPLRGGGYDPAAVDRFLDELAGRVERQASSPGAARETGADAAGPPGDGVDEELEARWLEVEAEAEDLLVEAREAAERTRAAARAEADRLVGEAQARVATATARPPAAGGPIAPTSEHDVLARALTAIGTITDLVASASLGVSPWPTTGRPVAESEARPVERPAAPAPVAPVEAPSAPVPPEPSRPAPRATLAALRQEDQAFLEELRRSSRRREPIAAVPSPDVEALRPRSDP